MIVGQVFNPYRKFTGYFVPECVLSYDGVSLGAKLCLAVLYRMIGKNDEAWPRQETLAARMGCSVRSVTSYISELEADGFIRANQRGLGQANQYEALWHKVFDEPYDDGCVSSNANSALLQPQTLRVSKANSALPSIELKRDTEERQGNSAITPTEELIDGTSARTIYEKYVKQLRRKRTVLAEAIGKMPPITVDDFMEAAKEAGARVRSANPPRDALAYFLGVLRRANRPSPLPVDPPRQQIAPGASVGLISENKSCSTLFALQQPPIVEQWNQITGQSVSHLQFDPDEWVKIQAKAEQIPETSLMEAFKKAAYILANIDESHLKNNYIEFDWVIMKGWASLLRSNKHNWLTRSDKAGPPKSAIDSLLEKIKRGEKL